MQGRKAIISDACVFCGACVPECHYQAIELILPNVQAEKQPEGRGIWVFAEFFAGQFKPVTFELLGEAQRLAKISGERLTAVVLGEQAARNYQQLIAYGADQVLAFPSVELNQRDEVLYP